MDIIVIGNFLILHSTFNDFLC